MSFLVYFKDVSFHTEVDTFANMVLQDDTRKVIAIDRVNASCFCFDMAFKSVTPYFREGNEYNDRGFFAKCSNCGC